MHVWRRSGNKEKSLLAERTNEGEKWLGEVFPVGTFATLEKHRNAKSVIGSVSLGTNCPVLPYFFHLLPGSTRRRGPNRTSEYQPPPSLTLLASVSLRAFGRPKLTYGVHPLTHSQIHSFLSFFLSFFLSLHFSHTDSKKK